MNIVVRHTGADPAAAQALRELDAQLLEFETLIAASLPHAESFDDTMSALAEVHRHREALRQAAGQGGRGAGKAGKSGNYAAVGLTATNADGMRASFATSPDVGA